MSSTYITAPVMQGDMLSKEYLDARDEGFEAYWDCKRQIENPYRGVDRLKAAGWDEGWKWGCETAEYEDGP
jgi:hypothetical protein